MSLFVLYNRTCITSPDQLAAHRYFSLSGKFTDEIFYWDEELSRETVPMLLVFQAIAVKVGGYDV